ncbi:MAG: hypothetical protein RSF67_03970 [Clostridia bacterium]
MVIIEGIDGVGKTTLVDYFVQNGMNKFHFDYDSKNMDLITKYMNILKFETQQLILDRSFISEMVYGPVIRGKCKLTIEDYKDLLIQYEKVGTSIIYLSAPKEILLSRRKNDSNDFEVIKNFYDELSEYYLRLMSFSKDYIEVLEIDTDIYNREEVQEKAKRLLLR